MSKAAEAPGALSPPEAPHSPEIVDTADEVNYLRAVRRVLSDGAREDGERTGAGTTKLTALQLRYRLTHAGDRDSEPCPTVPLLTCRRLPPRWIVEELFWFGRGSTDATELSEAGVKIWEGNTSAEFLAKRGLSDRLRPGELGPGYGWQWRGAGLDYWGKPRAGGAPESDERPPSGVKRAVERRRTAMALHETGTGVHDQLAEAFALLRTDPGSRRILVDSWNPAQLDEMALPPCHYSFQFVTRKLPLEHKKGPRAAPRVLDCVVTMRSGDLGLGIPYNCVSYALLTHLAALYAGMTPGELVLNIADAHVYETHREFLSADARVPLAPKAGPPRVLISPKVAELCDAGAGGCGETAVYSDPEVRRAAKFLDAVFVLPAADVFTFVGYSPGPKVSMPMAV